MTTAAVAAARDAQLVMLAEQGQIGYEDLPEDKSLLVGDQSDWK